MTFFRTVPHAASQTGAAPSPGRRVTDAPTRMFHWLFALCFVGAYLTADSERLRLVHVALGYTMPGLLGFRLLYGWFGPRQARLSALWGKLSVAPQWLRSLRSGPVNWRQGQNLLMAGAIVSMLLLVLPLVLSGHATFNEWGGDWVTEGMEEVHEFLGELFLILVVLHLGFLLGLSLWRRRNLAGPMLTGRMEGVGPDLVRRNHRWLAVLLLAGVMSYWTWEWQQAGVARDAGSEAVWQQRNNRGADHDDD